MDDVRVLVSVYLALATLLATAWFRMLETWFGSVESLRLRWEREQRQAAPTPIPLTNRQAVQAEFESVVSRRPTRSGWVVLLAVLVLFGFGVAASWGANDREWMALYIFAPMVLVWLIVLVAAFVMMRRGQAKMAAVSTTLYGPAPPRVKVRDIRAVPTEDVTSGKE